MQNRLRLVGIIGAVLGVEQDEMKVNKDVGYGGGCVK